MLKQEIKNLKKDKKSIKQFGFTVGVSLVVLSLVFWLLKKIFFWPLPIGGAIFAILGFIVPALLRPLYIVWMSFGVIMNFIVTRLVVGILFYFVATPIGLLMRFFSKRFDEFKIDRNSKSYWSRRSLGKTKKEHYEQQF